MPVYWRPKYGTRSSRHRAWARQEERRETALKRKRTVSLRDRLRRLLKR
jgi:hypothetical protein